MSDIIAIEEIRAGSGDKLDLRCDSMFHARDPFEINQSLDYERTVVDTYGNESIDNRTILDFEVSPGFFYIGDKEYHLYSQKVTEVVHVSAGDESIQLGDYPNGYSHIGLYGPFSESDFTGMFYDELIAGSGRMYSYYLNEANNYGMMDESGYVGQSIDEESGYYPLQLSPYHPASQCYTYWERKTGSTPLSYELYDYDLFQNRLIRYDDLPEGYYIVEYEHSTLRTLTGSSFNPLAKPVDRGFLVITADVDESPPDRINILDISEPSSTNRMTISFEIRNFLGNLVTSTDVNVSIVREWYDQQNREITNTLDDYNEYYTAHVVEPLNEQRTIYEDGLEVGKIESGSQKVVLKTEGLISDMEEGIYSYDATIRVNENGVGILYFLMPSIRASEATVKMVFSHLGKDMRAVGIRNNNSADGEAVLFEESGNYFYRVEEASSRIDENTIQVAVTGIGTMSGMVVYSMKNIIDYGTAGGVLTPLVISDYHPIGDVIILDILMPESDGNHVVVRGQDTGKNYIKLDSSSVYGLQ